MAKGLRSSTKKANRTQLRSQIFGPVEEARKERLSAKLLELASKPQTAAEEDVNMAAKHEGQGSSNVVRVALSAQLTINAVSRGSRAEGSSKR